MKKICLLIVILLFQPGYSQNALVPYRVKDKWGLSDLNGKMAVNAEYDKVFIGSNLADGYYGFKKGNVLGLIHNKKEILSGSYREFDVVKNKFIIAQSKRDLPGGGSYSEQEYEQVMKKREASFLFNLSGKNMYPDGFRTVRAFDSLGVSSKYKGHAKYLLFISENFDRQKSIFAYDVDKQDIANWLLKDHYKLALYGDGSFSNAKYYIKGHETGTAEEMIYTFSIAGNKIKVDITPATKPKQSSGYGSGSGGGNYGDGDLSIGSHSGDLYVEAAPSSGKRSYTTSIKVTGNTIDFKSTEYPRKMNSTDGIVEKKIILPYVTEWIKEERLYHDLVCDDGTKISFNNVAHFKTKEGTYGIVFLDTLMIKPGYTYLKPFRWYSGAKEPLNFFVGKRNDKNGSTKYGTIDIFEKEIVPMVYDSIFIEKSRYDSGFVRSMAQNRWNVLKDGKYGIIDINGKILFEAVYDTIYQNKKNYVSFRESDFTVLGKDGKYALYQEYTKDTPLFTAPVFIKPPGYYISNYQGQKGLMLVGLLDKDGDLYCYARKDGFLYYKE
ncbi:WG repeat-containing protein [Flavobacterium sp.]|uniref:WG repeat-containing protein n=3 Tax=Flavobacterium sp. TaxID=239 RepID=UPI0040348805